jgi:hypothetical protein
MWPIQFAFRLRISCEIFLCSLTLRDTSPARDSANKLFTFADSRHLCKYRLNFDMNIKNYKLRCKGTVCVKKEELQIFWFRNRKGFKHIAGVVIRIIGNVNVRYLSSCFFQNYCYFCRYFLNTRLWLIWRRTRIIVNEFTKPFFLGSVAKWTFKTAFYLLPTSRVKSLTRNHNSLKLCRFVVSFTELLSEVSNVKLIINHTGQFQQNLSTWFNDASCFAVSGRRCVQLWWQTSEDGGT